MRLALGGCRAPSTGLPHAAARLSLGSARPCCVRTRFLRRAHSPQSRARCARACPLGLAGRNGGGQRFFHLGYAFYRDDCLQSRRANGIRSRPHALVTRRGHCRDRICVLYGDRRGLANEGPRRGYRGRWHRHHALYRHGGVPHRRIYCMGRDFWSRRRSRSVAGWVQPLCSSAPATRHYFTVSRARSSSRSRSSASTSPQWRQHRSCAIRR